MHPARPSVPEQPCVVCGVAVDPLRAARLVAVGGGDEHEAALGPLCGAACGERFDGGERGSLTALAPVPAPRRSMPDLVRDATVPRLELASGGVAAPSAAHRAVFAPTPVPAPFLPAGLALVALLCALGSHSPALAGLSALLTLLSAALSLRAGLSRGDVDGLASIAAPTGTALAAASGMLARINEATSGPSFGLAGAAVAAACLAARTWLDARSRQPVFEVVHDLASRMPARVRVPAGDSALEMRYQEVHVSQIRTGEEIFVIEGESIGVDGVVQGGEAQVLLHPGAQSPSRRRAGDPVLAGTRVVQGAVRVLATHVGSDCALSRVAHFGDAGQRSAARVVRLSKQFARFGGGLAFAAAAVGVAVMNAPGLVAQLSAVAAVFLAAPLLALRRSADAPLIAGAASAAARGIVFHDAESLEKAGRTSTAVLCTTGVVTEGTPEVVEVQTVDGSPVEPLIALAAGVEGAAGDHPIALGIRAYAQAHGIRPEAVRRAAFARGRGVTADSPSGESLVVGNRALLLEEGISIAVADDDASRAEARGHTAVFLGLGGKVRAVLSLRDELRPGARAAVQRMFDLHMEVVLLSGDHRDTAMALAGPLDVTHVKAELMPSERGQEVCRLAESGGVVAAVGRTSADQAALEAAHVPVVLGAAGGGELERGITLATEDVRDAAAALWIARAARNEARRSVLLASVVGTFSLALAAMGWVAPALAALAALTVEAYALPAGARLLRRVELRVPAR